MILKRILVVAAILVTSPAFAAPVSLECVRLTKDRSETQRFEFVLDEESSTAVITYSVRSKSLGELVKKFPAIFTPSKVMFGGYTVNRTDLSFGNYAGQGQCKLIEAPKRAF